MVKNLIVIIALLSLMIIGCSSKKEDTKKEIVTPIEKKVNKKKPIGYDGW